MSVILTPEVKTKIKSIPKEDYENLTDAEITKIKRHKRFIGHTIKSKRSSLILAGATEDAVKQYLRHYDEELDHTMALITLITHHKNMLKNEIFAKCLENPI